MSEKELNLHGDEEMTVTLTLDDDTELECDVVAIFPVNGQDYIALLPREDEAEEVFLYRFKELENGEMELDNIENDDEFEAVADHYDAMLDDMEFEDMMGEDE